MGLLGGIFHLYIFFFFLNLFANSGEPDQTPRFAVSTLILHCLPMSHKKNARLIWVNKTFLNNGVRVNTCILKENLFHTVKIENKYCIGIELLPFSFLGLFMCNKTAVTLFVNALQMQGK